MLRFLTVFVLVLTGATVMGQHRGRCRVTERVVWEGQSTVYEVQIQNVQDVKIVTQPQVEGLAFEALNQGVRGQRITSINGRVTRHVDYALSWRVTPSTAGIFRIPMPELEADGKKVVGHEVSLTARAEEAQNLAKIEMSTTATDLVLGQSVGLTVDVYLKHLPAPAASGDPLQFHDRGFPSRLAPPQILVPWIPEPPFDRGRFAWKEWARAVMSSGKGLRFAGIEARERFVGEVQDRDLTGADGTTATWRRYRFYVALRADEVGTFDLAQATLEGSVAERSGSKFQAKTVFTRSQPIVLKVSEPPSEGRPEVYTGAVGHFQLEVEPPTPSEVAVGDPVYLTAVVSGSGFLDGVTLDLARQLGDGWRVEAPKVTDAPGPGEDRPAGTRPGNWRQFTFKLRPLRADVKGIPPIAFAYYDVDENRYIVRRSRPFPLTLRAAGTAIGDAGIVDATGGARSSDTPLAAGLSANQDDLNTLGDQRPRPLWWALGVLLLLPLWFASSSVVSRRRALAADPAILRRKKARPRARARIAEARRVLEQDPGVAVAGGTAALAGLFADLEDVPEDAVTSGDVMAWIDTFCDLDTMSAIQKLLDAGEAVAFGGTALDAPEVAVLLDAAETVARERRGRPISAALLPLLLCASVSAQDTDVFQRAQAAFVDRRYEDAARLWESMLSDEYQNGWVLYNAGNAWLKSGQVGRAIAAYRQAAWYLPGDANLDRNLNRALELRPRSLGATDDPGVVDTVLFWRRKTTFTGQAAATFLFAVLAFACAGIRLFSSRALPFLRWARWLLLVGVLLLAASATLTWVDQNSGDHACITADDTRLRKWPAKDADEALQTALHDGDQVAVVDRRGDWLKVEVAGEHAGWVPAARALVW